MSLADAIEQILRLRAAIDDAGGLVTVTTIARRLGVSKARAHEMTRADGFPPPVWTEGRSQFWTGTSVDSWRAEERPPGRPPRTTPQPEHHDQAPSDVTRYVVVTRKDRLPITRFGTIEAAADYIVQHRSFAAYTVMAQEADRPTAATPYRKLYPTEQRALEQKLYPSLFE